MGGTNDPSNLIKVNVTLHAFLHKLLWEEHGKWQDEVAFKNLSGTISSQEAIRESRIRANIGNKHRLGKPKSDEEKRKISNSLTGRQRSKESIEKQKKSLIGRKQTQEHIENKRKSTLGKKREIVTCPHCGNSGGINAMKIHHFNKCKKKAE